jgi:hypothetical protein
MKLGVVTALLEERARERRVFDTVQAQRTLRRLVGASCGVAGSPSCWPDHALVWKWA